MRLLAACVIAAVAGCGPAQAQRAGGEGSGPGVPGAKGRHEGGAAGGQAADAGPGGPGGGETGTATAATDAGAGTVTGTRTPDGGTVVVRPQPKPRRLFFKPQKSTLDLGAPVLALAAGDVDADGVVELVALTTREVVVLTLAKDAATVETRIPLTGNTPLTRPRDPVGALIVTDVIGDATPEILAHASDRADGVLIGWKEGALVAIKDLGEYPLFAVRDASGTSHLAGAMLGEGVNDFPRESISFAPATKEWTAAGLPARFLAAEGTSVLAADGTTRQIIGFVDGDGELSLHAFPRVGVEPMAKVADAGSAFEIVDLDGDGSPEVITSAYRAPGDGDELVVYTIDDDGTTRVLHHGGALRGGIAAIASGDFDSDGATDVAALVRLSGATAGDLWVLR